MKKALTIYDLVKFIRENNYNHFSSKECGFKLAVQVPATFEVDENTDDDHRGMMKLKIRVFHTGLNRNGSFVSEDAAKDAMPTIKNRPLMAYIHKRNDGEYDFETHNMTIETDEDGKEYIEYQEKQIGSFDETPPFFEYDKDLDKTYICAYAYVSEGYTRACDIIRRKNGSKNSVELDIEELAYNAKDNYLDLQKFYVAASTLLGSKDDGTEIGEGMLGSRADIVDFSQENNSIVFNKSELVKEITQAVIKQLGDNKTAFDADNKSKEGGTDVFEKLLKKYNKTKADITFDYEGLSDEELEALFAEHFEDTKKKKKVSGNDDSAVVSGEEGEPSSGEGDQNQNANPDQNQNTNTTTDDQNQNQNSNPDQSQNSNPDDNQNSNPDNQTTTGENQNGEPEQNQNAEPTTGEDNGEGQNDNPDSGEGTENFTKTFELSHSDIRSGLYALLAPYEEEDNEWYWITDVYDDHFIYEGWSSEHLYDQKYSRDGDNIKFEGERVHLNVEYLTDSELVALNEMRSNYSQIQSKLASYEAEPEKIAILESDCYSQISETEAFKDLMKQETHFDMSVEDVQAKADAMLLEFAKTNKIEFSSKKESEPAKKVGMKMLPVNKKSGGRSRYGGLFAKSE